MDSQIHGGSASITSDRAMEGTDWKNHKREKVIVRERRLQVFQKYSRMTLKNFIEIIQWEQREGKMR